MLARFNLCRLQLQEKRPLRKIQNVLNEILAKLASSGFTGILLTEWEDQFPASIFNATLALLDELGLEIYLETSGPDFLKDGDVLQTDCIAGLVIRNASIMPNGEKRDYFQMEKLRPTIKAFVSEACLRDFTVMSWETIDDDAVLRNAVVKRGLQWCSFYSTIAWIGTKSALRDASKNVPRKDPLGAFGWLKNADLMKCHDIWRFNPDLSQASNESATPAWEQIGRIFQEVGPLLASSEIEPNDKIQANLALQDPTDWVFQVSPKSHPLSVSATHSEYSSLGCFPLGFDANPLAFAEIIQSQIRLRELGLLHPVAEPQIKNMGSLLRRFYEAQIQLESSLSSQAIAAIRELSTLSLNGFLRINLGLNSGFRKSAEVRFWSVYAVDSEGLEIFASKNAQGLVSLVLHTFLSSRGFARHECLQAEFTLSKWSNDLVGPAKLPRRFAQDIESLTPEETLFLYQHISLSKIEDELTLAILAGCRAQLIDQPSQAQLKQLNTVGYLDGSISAEEVIRTRLAWHSEKGRQHPTFEAALALFQEVHQRFAELLRDREENILADIVRQLQSILVKDQIDPYADILALSIFCAARRWAVEEVYAEVTDRNPLFNDQSDQAAAFAESFALGSRCEAYFDVSPSVFGKILSDRFRKYYNKHQPPNWVNGAPDLATSYAGAQIDVNPKDKPKSMPGYQRFTFMSVFAIPALIDIILLTLTGRGLYLSAFMSYNDQQAATTALMISLLLSGAIGTWISCGGSYYLISMAFSAMHMFVLTRFVAGMAFTIAGGLIGLVVMSAVKGGVQGAVFLLYFVALTAYLSLFAAISCFQFPGSSFLSGRKVIIMGIPILFISPIVTTFAGHDTIVYLSIMYLFIGVMFLGLRHIGSKWVTWYQNIRKTNDGEVRKWYLSTYANDDEKALGAMSDPAALKLAREALLNDVQAEMNKGYFTKPSEDKLVQELARDWESTTFLLDWYCRYSDVPKPIPYSSTWNIQTKCALDTLSAAQKGIRLHSAFIHWRQAGDEVGCGVLYFLVALLDKWIDLLSGGQLIGLSASLTDAYRMAVGFGLAYYLIGAVLIDTKAQALHDYSSKIAPTGIKTNKDIRAHQKREIKLKRHVYWKTLGEFFLWHSWSLAFSAALIWTFQGSLDSMIMFVSYVGAYTGLLWYQYTKIFSGPHALKPLLAAIIIALPLGIALKKSFPDFHYNSVIALATGTWTVAILSLWTAKIGMPKKVQSPVELGKFFHAHTAPWADPEWSQQELQSFFESIRALPKDSRYKVDPSAFPGTEVRKLLIEGELDSRARDAFPNIEDLIDHTLKLWETKQVQIELVPMSSLQTGVRAITCLENDHLTILVGAGRGANEMIDISGNCVAIAEILLHAVCNTLCKMPDTQAVLLQSIFKGEMAQNMEHYWREEPDASIISKWTRKELLKQLCLGYDPDLCWDDLPAGIRLAMLQRVANLPCSITEQDWAWLDKNLSREGGVTVATYVARCNFGASKATDLQCIANNASNVSDYAKQAQIVDEMPRLPTKLHFFTAPLSYLYHLVGLACKFFIIAMVADPEFQREFRFVMSKKPPVIRAPLVFLLSCVWTYARFIQHIGLIFFMFHGRENVKKLWDETKGMKITLKRNRVVVRSLDGTFTAFKHTVPSGGFKLMQYKGVHKSEPAGNAELSSISTFSKKMQLLVKEEYSSGSLTSEYQYDYQAPKTPGRLVKAWNTKVPIARRCVRGPKNLEHVQYNKKGLIEAGSYMKDGNLIRFKLHYRKNTRFSDELLRAEFVLSHLTCTVSWCAPPRTHPEKIDRWIPHSKVTEATFVQGADVYESRWLYDHKYHPTIFTTLNGQKVQTPPMIEHDYLNVLKKPLDTNFILDNPLFYCDSLNSNIIQRTLGLSVFNFPISTSRARSTLWRAWKNRVDFDGVIVRWMDERLMRRDDILAPYWRARNRGNLVAAKKYLDMRADAIMASADLADDISSWTPLAIKISDLFNFGPGGDAVVNTRSKDVGLDTKKTLHVMAADNGTWPNEGGGVSACRRDMINSLKTIKWHMVCESATDFGVPKHQTEQNVQSLKVIPLWGLDFLTPTHGLFTNKLDSEVDYLATKATDADIKRNFIPTLTALVKAARAKKLSSADLQQATRALVNLNNYFQDSRHWGQVWTSDIVKESWRDLWLTQEMDNATPSAEWFDTELPTLGHLDTAMDLWFRYLFIFSIPVPDKIPAVFQASHHSVSASYGIVCKIKRKCTLQIWDHAISWRETNLCLSSALCKLAPFVRNSLLGLMRMTSVLILHHADIILPCADFFNPGWEVEIGSCQGTIEHRNSFKRKIDPVVNGITDMDNFAPVKEIKAQRPTVTMLSHVWYAKDIKIALLAADIIVNKWGFDDYHLDIYGAIDKAPTYSTECQEIIASKSLRNNVVLRGTANPIKVLENTWLFLNSSLSEGLPLALGEAALTGAPVVCTDVGASLRVLSDPEDFSRYSAVVAPNDAESLARAQLELLGLLGEWSKYADDTEPAPVLTSAPTREDVEKIQKRMYDKSEQRRKLGIMTRNIVQKSFSGDRYLREHEQMLWIGKSQTLIARRNVNEAESEDIVRAMELAAAPAEEEVITIPRSIVNSWRTSAASGISSAFTDYTAVNSMPAITEPEQARRAKAKDTRPMSARSAYSSDSANAGFPLLVQDGTDSGPPSPTLPIFAPNPRHSAMSSIRPSMHSRNGSGSHRSIHRLRSPPPSVGGTNASTLNRSRNSSPGRRYQLRGLAKENLRLYRNSDLSFALRDEQNADPRDWSNFGGRPPISRPASRSTSRGSWYQNITSAPNSAVIGGAANAPEEGYKSSPLRPQMAPRTPSAIFFANRKSRAESTSSGSPPV